VVVEWLVISRASEGPKAFVHLPPCEVVYSFDTTRVTSKLYRELACMAGIRFHSGL
jgi:hypothetical protein